MNEQFASSFFYIDAVHAHCKNILRKRSFTLRNEMKNKQIPHCQNNSKLQ